MECCVMYDGNYNQQYLCAMARSYLKNMSAYEFSEWKLKGFDHEFLSDWSKRPRKNDTGRD